ncbi:LysR family transcriptional regulator [Luteibacter sp. PPL201]|uniref:LysR family transcriptional regulator n=1 Tax=Luteibacter sahnii TaxID=3021977 RepID=A0ABT6BFF3_9GAMM
MPPDPLSHLSAFAAVARHASFRKAGAELGLSTSAVSYAIRGLEARLGVMLFHRTTRSVSLTEAGRRLFERLQPALRDVGEALAQMNDFRAAPAGTLRINMPRSATRLLMAPVLPAFLRRYPDIHVEVVDNDGLIDIVADGYDAGVRLHESVPEDMVAIPFGTPQRSACVATPAYLAERGVPLHPYDLAMHDCIRYRFPSGRLYKWEFGRVETELEIDVRGRCTFGDLGSCIDAALGGVGIALALHGQVEPYLHDGRLVSVLDDWCPPYPGFMLYYPRQRGLTSALRAFIDLLREVGPGLGQDR